LLSGRATVGTELATNPVRCVFSSGIEGVWNDNFASLLEVRVFEAPLKFLSELLRPITLVPSSFLKAFGEGVLKIGDGNAVVIVYFLNLCRINVYPVGAFLRCARSHI
jgi:hypothetical protein